MNLHGSPKTSFKDEAGRSADKIRVLVVDDHSGVRKGIKNLLQSAQDIVVVGEGGNGAEAIELAATRKPDILLLMKVLAVSSYSDRDYILGMLENGAAGYITKDEAPMMLVDAIRSIINKGISWFSPRAIKNSGIPSLEEQTLTKREVEILEQLIIDQSPQQIASVLNMHVEQVDRYLKLLMRKFETESMVSLKHIATRILSRRGS